MHLTRSQDTKILFCIIFERAIITFIRPAASIIYGIHHSRGLKLLPTLRVGISDQREQQLFY